MTRQRDWHRYGPWIFKREVSVRWAAQGRAAKHLPVLPQIWSLTFRAWAALQSGPTEDGAHRARIALKTCDMAGVAAVPGQIHWQWIHTTATVQHARCAPGRTHRPLSCHDNSKSKNIPVIRRGGLQGCKMLMIPHCLDQRWPTGGPRLDLLRPPPSLRFILKNLNFTTVMI
jgi:hypothetical protein